MRLLSRLEAKQSQHCAIHASLGHRSWASCPIRSLLLQLTRRNPVSSFSAIA
jgi:hypothetical protein